MRRKDFEELKKLGELELKERLENMKAGLYRLRLQHRLGQMKDTASLNRSKKDIARVYTLLSLLNKR